MYVRVKNDETGRPIEMFSIDAEDIRVAATSRLWSTPSAVGVMAGLMITASALFAERVRVRRRHYRYGSLWTSLWYLSDCVLLLTLSVIISNASPIELCQLMG